MTDRTVEGPDLSEYETRRNPLGAWVLWHLPTDTRLGVAVTEHQMGQLAWTHHLGRKETIVKDAYGNEMTPQEEEDARRFVGSKKIQDAIDKAAKEVQDNKDKKDKK